MELVKEGIAFTVGICAAVFAFKKLVLENKGGASSANVEDVQEESVQYNK